MQPAEFIIIGGGWRAEFYLRAARALPNLFTARGVLVRDPAKAATIQSAWGVPTAQHLDELIGKMPPLFAVVSVPRTVAPSILKEVANKGIPILCETPPANDVEGLSQVNELTSRGGRIQVAEQFIFQPMHAARIAVARSGLLGTVSQAQVSFSHGYHGISLLRHYLDVKFEPVRITARRFQSPIFKGPDRAGPPREEKIIDCAQTIATFEFGNRVGIFDFAHDQHRSYVRSDRILVRGERGEINQTGIRHLIDFRTPMEFNLHRFDAGVDENLEGYFHKGIVGGGRWWYENPFPGARLADDEIAVATCLAKMTDYARGGDDFYSLAEASHDQYLSLEMDRAVLSGQTIEVQPQSWAG